MGCNCGKSFSGGRYNQTPPQNTVKVISSPKQPLGLKINKSIRPGIVRRVV